MTQLPRDQADDLEAVPPMPVDVEAIPPVEDEPQIKPFGLPLFAWVLIAVGLAIPTGLALGSDASTLDSMPAPIRATLRIVVAGLELAPTIIIRALGALAAPLVVLAILSAIVSNEVRGRQGAKMMGYYLINTLVAMTIGLALANAIRPGARADLSDAAPAVTGGGDSRPTRIIEALSGETTAPSTPPSKRSVRELILDLVPKSIGAAFVENNLAQLVLVTIALAIGLAQIRDRQRARGETSHKALADTLTVGFELLMKVLLWVVALVPIAVFGVVATSLARRGFDVFLDLGWFIVAVLAGLTCQVVWYIVQLLLLARTGPVRFLGGASDVMATTFSTASTAATIPVTLTALTRKLGVSRESSQLAACVGTNFNNDGTALYQATAALFFAQALGFNLDLTAQIIVMVTTLVASVGAGGIPSGSFVTLPLIFAAVDLPADKLPILLTIDWFLDRCRTTSNVLGDMTVAILIDRGKSPNSDGR